MLSWALCEECLDTLRDREGRRATKQKYQGGTSILAIRIVFVDRHIRVRSIDDHSTQFGGRAARSCRWQIRERYPYPQLIITHKPLIA